LYVGIRNNVIPGNVVQVKERDKQPIEKLGRLYVAILAIIAVGAVLPLLLSQGFIAVVALLKIGVVNILFPLFLGSIGPQEKEPPNSLL
jgi:hypothetical protein